MHESFPFSRSCFRTAFAFVLFTLFFAFSAYANPFLWEVEKDGRTNHLMGTVHSSHPLVRELSPAVVRALGDSTVFLPELELSYENVGRMMAAVFDFDGSDWEERLPEELHLRLRGVTQAAGIPDLLLRNLSFEMIPFLLAQPPGENFAELMDVQLYQIASTNGIDVRPLESLDEQLGVFADLDDETIVRMIEEALDEAENGYPEFRRLIEAYASGESEAVSELMLEMKQSMPEAFSEALFERRNEKMVARALPHLREGGAFVAVGLGHLLGENSMAELLRKDGFTVRRSPPD